jgi:[ribosomal protein S18]-alanine N-acetyltransferase
MIPVVRDLDSDTLELAASLHQRCFDDYWPAGTLQELLSVLGTIGIAAFIDRAMIAMAIARTIDVQCDILTICVAPAHRGAGIGRTVLRAVELRARASGAETVFLEVAETNAAATGLYRDAGYGAIATRRNYYSSELGKVNAIVMKKSLRPQDLPQHTIR